MPNIQARPIDRPGLTPLTISPRLRSQLVYFACAPGVGGVPDLAEGEFWFDPEQVRGWLDDGVISLVSPLDTANMTEVELSEDQEAFLQWLQSNGVSHVAVEG